MSHRSIILVRVSHQSQLLWCRYSSLIPVVAFMFGGVTLNGPDTSLVQAQDLDHTIVVESGRCRVVDLACL